MRIRFKTMVLRQLIWMTFLLCLPYQEIFSQEADSMLVKKPGLFVGLTMGPTQTMILNEGMSNVKNLVSVKGNGVSGTLEFGYFFSANFGLSSGIGYTACNGHSSLDSYQSKFNTTDSENEPYERQVLGIHLLEDQNIGLLTLPISANFRIPLGGKFGLFLQTGIELNKPITQKYHSSGTFTFKGFYPAYNVLLQNLPAYGFPTNATSAFDGTLNLKPISFDAIATAGIDFQIHKNLSGSLAACYHQSLSSISNQTAPENFQLSTDVNQINSLMGGSSKVTIQSIGLKIAVRYFLNHK